MPADRSSLLRESRWRKKHGNVITRLLLEDADDPMRLRLRVIDSGGSTAYRKGDTVSMDAHSLRLYYEPEKS